METISYSWSSQFPILTYVPGTWKNQLYKRMFGETTILYVTVPYSHTKGCIVWVRLTKDASSKAKGKETPAEWEK